MSLGHPGMIRTTMRAPEDVTESCQCAADTPFSIGCAIGVWDTCQQGNRDRPEYPKAMAMRNSKPTEYRVWGIRLVTILLIVSFAFIPVRCDASTAPHSIFVDPTGMNMERMAGHQHAAAASSESGSMTGHHHHGAPTSSSDADSADASHLLCQFMLADGADAQSQQPVGAALDLPATPVPPDIEALLQMDGDPLMQANPPAAMLTGISIPPDSPPPKAA